MKSNRKGLRLIALAMCVAVLFGLAAPAMAASVFAYGTVNANNAPVYSSTAKTTTLGVFNIGDVVAIESQVSAYNMYVVRLSPSSASTGYIDKALIGSVTTSLKTGTTVATLRTGTTTGTPGVIANCTQCNFRATASTSGALLGSLNKGTAVTVLATQGDFYKITYNGQTGYVSKQYVSVTSGGSTGGTTTGTPGVIANVSSYANFRATASSTGAIISTLNKGTAVTVLATQGEFYKIIANGKTGYVDKRYVSLTSSGGNTGGTTTPTSGTITGTGSYVVLRSTASTSASTVARLSIGVTVSIGGESGSWYKVTSSGKTGYVPKANVKLSGSAPTTTGTPGVIANVSSYANFRATASSTGTVISKLNLGTSVNVLATEGSFYKLTASGKTGYVDKRYVSLTTTTEPGNPGTSTGTDTGAISVGTGAIKVEPYQSTTASAIATKIAAAEKINSKTIGYISISGTNIQQPILYYGSSNVHYYSNHDIYNKTSTSGAIYAFYGQMVRNNTITGHNMRSSNGMFHQLHHIQERTLGYTKCQTTDATCKGSFSTAPSLTSAANQTWDISLFGYNKWQIWAMYETPASESTSTLKYNINPLSSYSPSQIKTWIAYQKSRSEYKFNTAVSTDDIFLTVFTCGNNYDNAAAQSRIYYFLKAVK